MNSSNVAMIYSDSIKRYSYGDFHPMKPERASMTYDLLIGYDAF